MCISAYIITVTLGIVNSHSDADRKTALIVWLRSLQQDVQAKHVCRPTCILWVALTPTPKPSNEANSTLSQATLCSEHQLVNLSNRLSRDGASTITSRRPKTHDINHTYAETNV